MQVTVHKLTIDLFWKKVWKQKNKTKQIIRSRFLIRFVSITVLFYNEFNRFSLIRFQSFDVCSGHTCHFIFNIHEYFFVILSKQTIKWFGISSCFSCWLLLLCISKKIWIFVYLKRVVQNMRNWNWKTTKRKNELPKTSERMFRLK